MQDRLSAQGWLPIANRADGIEARTKHQSTEGSRVGQGADAHAVHGKQNLSFAGTDSAQGKGAV